MDNARDRISAILSDPENLKTLAKLASGFMSAGETSSVNQSQTASVQDNAETAEESVSVAEVKPETPDAGSAGANVLSDLAGGLGGTFRLPGDPEKSIGLLTALKPYLGNRKKQTCDIIIKLLRAAKLLGILDFSGK